MPTSEVVADAAGTPSGAGQSPGSPVDPERLAAIERAQEVWKGQLVDLGANNTLLYYKDLKVGTLNLGPDSDANDVAVKQLLASHAVGLHQLFEPEARPDATKRARTIRAKATENFDERGLRTLFLALGMATWTNTRSAATPAAPVLLRQAQLAPHGRAEESFELSLPGEWEVNPTLLYALQSDFEVSLDPDELLELLDESGTGAADASPLFERLQKAAADVPGFDVTRRVVLGNFSYAKWEMVQDLESGTEALVASDLLCAIAGYEPAGQALRDRQAPAEAGEPDRVAPGDEFLVVDANASQSYVINAVVGGSDLVIEGPPGTGKSQTIANLIASLAARGRSVLFVAEKRAAVDAVLDRLVEVDLSDLVLDLHGGVTSKRKLAQDLARALANASSTPLPDAAAIHQTLARRRAELVTRNEALHRARAPWGISVYEAQSRFLGVAETARSRVRLRGDALEVLDEKAYDDAVQALRTYANLGGLRLSAATSPWASALASGSVATPADAQAALNGASGLSSHTWPDASQRLSRLVAECGLRPPEAVASWAQAFQLLDGVAGTLERFELSVYEVDLDALSRALAPSASNTSRLIASLTNSAYRAAKRQLRTHVRPGVRLSAGALLEAVSAAAGQQERWKSAAIDGGRPRLPSDLAGVEGAYGELSAELRALGAYVGVVDLASERTEALSERLQALAVDTETLYKLPELTRLRAILWRLGLGPLVEELTQRNLDVDAALGALEAVWTQSILDRVAIGDPVIGTFEGTAASRNVTEFAVADRDHIASGPPRIRRAVAERITAARDRFPHQSDVVRKQAALSRRFMPMRDLFQVAPDVLGALKPCFAISPLVVSQLLPMQVCFDVAIFDEASQVTPQDAAGVIARAGRVVVAGDRHQLPPDVFFSLAAAAGSDDGRSDGAADGSLVSDVESVLEQMSSVLPVPHGTKSLTWHYRSQDERLIAFSNAQESLYDYSMTTFPGAGIDDAITHVHVPFRPGRPADDDSSGDEVRRVVELVAEHARSRPGESLGVIAMGAPHATRIEEGVRRARQEDDVLDAFVTGSASPAARRRPFFVKNLQRVQGDERDAIILTIGYTKSPEGRMRYNFGPLNKAGGERRLNVAVTRAARRMTLVSSFTSADLDPKRLNAEGMKMIARYLAYAESAGTNLGEMAKVKPDLNAFERDVLSELTRAGIPLIPQWGASGYSIDYVAQHPIEPGRMVLAIECDGATYHSSETARDRDRLRQEHLERLGWRFHRIWSTEWFRHRDAEIARALAAYEAAVAHSNTPAPTAPHVAAQAPSAETVAVPQRKGPRPVVAGLGSINDYSDDDLARLIRWINSDTLLRTEEELLQVAIRELGFQKRGSRIVAAIEDAIAEVKRQA